MSTDTHKRPGTNLIQVGLLLVAIGVILAMIAIGTGGRGNLLFVSGLGAVMALVGFGQRILAAIEK